uniref:Uncharacterized protein n=1 Tax=Ditylenchus dipsaci TaxID=166011 RepID=A0A915D0V9_9BILA
MFSVILVNLHEVNPVQILVPFLGVHHTQPLMEKSYWVQMAVLAFKREGYKYSDISLPDLFESLTFSGMRKLIFKYASVGIQEMYRGIFISAQVKQLQKFVPELKRSDVIRGRAGVRAQALSQAGELVDDFVFDDGQGELGSRLLHVRTPQVPTSAGCGSSSCVEPPPDDPPPPPLFP